MDTFQEYKKKIINAIDYNDAESFVQIAESLLSDKEIEIKILHSILNKNRYNNSVEFKKFLLYLNIFNRIEYKSEGLMLLEDLHDTITNNVQINTIKRIIEKKPDNPQNINYTKHCPHCSKDFIGNENTKYVVCGYGDKGYDWKGCGKDWCFVCNKKLCKSWNTDHLYNKLNRVHDSKCCKNYSYKSKSVYPNDFCQCQNTDYIKR